MMNELLNTLFVQTQGTYIHLHQDNVRVESDGEVRLQVPVHHLSGIVLFGNCLASPYLIHRFAQDGRTITWFTQAGRFQARLEGPISGNVMLRKAQYQRLQAPEWMAQFARACVQGKIRNARQLLLRAIREGVSEVDRLHEIERDLRSSVRDLNQAFELNTIRGIEGQAARRYFGAFELLVRSTDDEFRWEARNRRPPRDPLNALLSFAYALVTADCVSACSGVGLDPQVGYLHVLRPGRPALGLDLAEEFRAALADRLVLALINRRQVRGRDFLKRPGGAVELTEDARRTFIEAYQTRKQETVIHPLLKESVPMGLLPHIQARLLARVIRGDTPTYVPFIVR